jgi:hypothetical protein
MLIKPNNLELATGQWRSDASFAAVSIATLISTVLVRVNSDSLNKRFSNIVVVSFTGGGNRRKPLTCLKTANLRKQYVMDATRKVILSKPAEQAVSHILRKRLDLCTGQVKIQKLIQMVKWGILSLSIFYGLETS